MWACPMATLPAEVRELLDLLVATFDLVLAVGREWWTGTVSSCLRLQADARKGSDGGNGSVLFPAAISFPHRNLSQL